MRQFPANEGDRRRSCCRATGGAGRAARPGPARGSFPGLLPGALRRGFFPRFSPKAFSRGEAAARHLRHVAGRRRRPRAAGERRRPGQSRPGTGKERGRGRVKPTLETWQVSVTGKTLIRCYRQHAHKNPRCFQSEGGRAGCPR